MGHWCNRHFALKYLSNLLKSNMLIFRSGKNIFICTFPVIELRFCMYFCLLFCLCPYFCLYFLYLSLKSVKIFIVYFLAGASSFVLLSASLSLTFHFFNITFIPKISHVFSLNTILVKLLKMTRQCIASLVICQQ